MLLYFVYELLMMCSEDLDQLVQMVALVLAVVACKVVKLEVLYFEGYLDENKFGL